MFHYINNIIENFIDWIKAYNFENSFRSFSGDQINPETREEIIEQTN